MIIELHEQAKDTERQLRAKKVPEKAITEHLMRKYPECFEKKEGSEGDGHEAEDQD